MTPSNLAGFLGVLANSSNNGKISDTWTSRKKLDRHATVIVLSTYQS
jgi:hypothetical protein